MAVMGPDTVASVLAEDDPWERARRGQVLAEVLGAALGLVRDARDGAVAELLAAGIPVTEIAALCGVRRCDVAEIAKTPA